jgi:hypothetical protein
MVEFAVVSPALLLIGLGLIQVGLVFQAKSGLSFALQEAARSGSENNANPGSVRDGLLRGLVPFMGGGRDAGKIATTLAAATAEFARGTAEGWIRMKQLSPTPQSFTDWQQPSVDDKGNAVTEIPNANLAMLRCTLPPNAGSAGVKASTACSSGEQIGANSQQTLADANLLKLQLTYGVKLGVPLINRIVGGALRMYYGCSAPTSQRIGPLNLGTPTAGTPDALACAALSAVDASGNPEPRIPVSLAITVRMQSPARVAGGAGWYNAVARNRSANTSGAQLGNGTVDAASEFAPIPVAQLNPNGVTQSQDSQAAAAGHPNGLNFGYETLGDTSGVTCTGVPAP